MSLQERRPSFRVKSQRIRHPLRSKWAWKPLLLLLPGGRGVRTPVNDQAVGLAVAAPLMSLTPDLEKHSLGAHNLEVALATSRAQLSLSLIHI